MATHAAAFLLSASHIHITLMLGTNMLRSILLLSSAALGAFAYSRMSAQPNPMFITEPAGTDWVAVAAAIGSVVTAIEGLTKAITYLVQLIREKWSK